MSLKLKKKDNVFRARKINAKKTIFSSVHLVQAYIKTIPI